MIYVEQLSIQYVALGARRFWTWWNISSRKKGKKLNVFNDLLISLLSYGEVLALLLFVKLQNSSLLTRRLICLSWSLYFWSCLRGLWINNKQWEDVAFCRTGFQIKVFVPLEANLLQKFLGIFRYLGILFICHTITIIT